MTRCPDCGATRTADQCEACGLTSAAAEVVLRRRLARRTAFFLLGTLVFVGATQIFPLLEMDAVFIFAGLVFFFALGLAYWIDRRARRRDELEMLKRAYFGCVPVPWLLAALLFLNGWMDREPPTRHGTSIVGKFNFPGMVLSSRRLVVTSWREGRRIERVPVDRDDFDRFRVGDAVDIEVKGGFAGIPWVYAVYRR